METGYQERLFGKWRKGYPEAYDGSLFNALSSLYPHEYWYGNVRVPKDYWNHLENHRLFMKVSSSEEYEFHANSVEIEI